jgi:hypothetical protein
MPRRPALAAAAGRRAAGDGGSDSGVVPLFSDTFPNFNHWNSIQWSTSGVVTNTSGDEYAGTGDYSCELVAIDGRTNVVRFELRDGDTPFGTGNERAEIGEPFASTHADLQVVEGDERWICWDMKFHSTWPTATSWCLVWQWHHSGSTGSPPLTVTMGTNDNIYLRNDNEDLLTLVQPTNRNVWERWIVHAVFSANPAVGFIECWVDGVQKVAPKFQRTMVIGDAGNYFKTGVYRDSVNTGTAIRYFDNFSIWDVLPPELGGVPEPDPDTAVRFDAAADRLSYSAVAPPATFTITAWIYISVNRVDFSTVARLWTSGGATVATWATGSNGAAGPNYNSTSGSVASAGNLTAGQWQKVAISRTGSTGRILGAPGGGGTTEVVSGTVATSTPAGITIGGRGPSDATEWWNGRISQFRVWDSVLTQAQIEAEWNSPTPVITSGLWANWPLSTATDLTDTVNARTLTVAAGGGLATEGGPPNLA